MDISVELSPFAVKSMFWLQSEPITLQEITYPDLVVARTVENNVYAKILGINKIYYGDVKIVNARLILLKLFQAK